MVELELGCWTGEDRACQPSLAALRHNDNVSGSRLAGCAPPSCSLPASAAHRGIDRVRRTPDLAYSFLRHAGLSVS